VGLALGGGHWHYGFYKAFQKSPTGAALFPRQLLELKYLKPILIFSEEHGGRRATLNDELISGKGREHQSTLVRWRWVNRLRVLPGGSPIAVEMT
jgi:hypothetical protein